MSADEPISRYGLTTVNDDPETIAGEPAEIDRALELIGKAVGFAQNIKKFIPGGKLPNQFLTAVNVIFEKRNYIQQNEILSIQLRAKVAIGLKILAEESERLEGLQFAKDATKTYLSALKEVEVTLKSLDHKNGMRQLIGQATWNFVNSDQVTKKFKGLEAKLDSAYDDLRSARELYMAQKISQVAEIGQKTQERVNLLLTELRKASLEIGVLDISSLAGGAALGENTRERLTLKRTEILYENNEEVRGKRGQVVKILLKPAEEVAMIKRARIMPPEEEREKSFWLEAAIAHYLRYNKYISAFRGVIDHNGDHYMIYDWAEHGDLSVYLEKHKDLCWKLKLKIAYQVASGLSYCHKREIVHHNVRSKSVLLDNNLDAKLTNFELSRNEEANSKELADDSIERYTAPEKIYNYQDRTAEKRYTKQCDVFSFGLLLWELAEHTKPYPEIENNHLVASIYRKGERPEIKKSGMPAGYRDIMEKAWRQEPFARPEMAEISRDLYIMLQNYRSADPDSLPPSPQFEPSDTESSTSIDELTNTPTLKSALELEKQKKYNEAFSIFHSHALKDGIAQYKIGFYFFHGEPYTTSKNLTESEKYLKMSADSGNADAQYLLFQLLLEQAIAQKKKPYIAEAYLKMAVDQGHPDALLAYGQHCLKHTFGHLDNIKGLGCLMLALFAWVFGDRSKDR